MLLKMQFNMIWFKLYDVKRNFVKVPQNYDLTQFCKTLPTFKTLKTYFLLS